MLVLTEQELPQAELVVASVLAGRWRPGVAPLRWPALPLVEVSEQRKGLAARDRSSIPVVALKPRAAHKPCER